MTEAKNTYCLLKQKVIKLFRLVMFSCRNGIVRGIKSGTTTKSFGIRVKLTGYGKAIEISAIKYLYGWWWKYRVLPDYNRNKIWCANYACLNRKISWRTNTFLFVSICFELIIGQPCEHQVPGKNNIHFYQEVNVFIWKPLIMGNSDCLSILSRIKMFTFIVLTT